MKNILKKTVFVMLILSMLITPTMGEEATDKLMLDMITLEMAENTYEIKKLDYEILQYQDKYDEAQRDRFSGGSTLESLLSQRYNVIKAQMDLDYSIWNREQKSKEVKLNSEELFFDYILGLDEIELHKLILTDKQTSLDEAKEKNKLGLNTLKEIRSAELQVENQMYHIQSLENNLSLIMYELNKNLRWELTKVIDVVYEEIPRVEKVDIDIAKVVEESLVDHGDVVKKVQNLEMKEAYIEALDNAGTIKSSNDYVDALRNKELAILELAEAKSNLEFKIRSEFNNLISSEQSVKIKELELENVSSQLSIMMKRFELGLETQAALNSAIREEQIANISLERARLELYFLYNEFVNKYE